MSAEVQALRGARAATITASEMSRASRAMSSLNDLGPRGTVMVGNFLPGLDSRGGGAYWRPGVRAPGRLLIATVPSSLAQAPVVTKRRV